MSDVTEGGAPKPGTKPDKRLKTNQSAPAPAAKPAGGKTAAAKPAPKKGGGFVPFTKKK